MTDRPHGTDGSWHHLRERNRSWWSVPTVRPMVDPTSDLGEDVTAEDAPTCETCGEPIVHVPTHRVVTWIEDDAVRTAHFCDDDCRAEWDG